MTEYEFASTTFSADETVDIPDAAVGVTVSTFGDLDEHGVITARYLVPTDGGRDD
ncbi:hypothetical protein U3A55_12070 [Salarchaeum sp. III]|uniref:hypothetical protein n=1 Tax=Salarchaeum sp. III TaxID=3107927 RepID=UPI002EDA0310